MMKETPWKEYKEGAQKYRIRAQHGIDYHFSKEHNQAPHFSVTGDIERQARNNRWMEDSSGSIHDDIARHFPKLAKYIPWHLVSTESPMHYLANARYWYEKIGKPKTKSYDPDPEEAFKETIVFGAIPGEKLPVRVQWPQVKEWLKGRLEPLMDNFTADMKELGVLE